MTPHGDGMVERIRAIVGGSPNLILDTAPASGVLPDLVRVAGGDPADARILCVGAGTGPELLYLAKRFPGWRFVAVEPSAPMLDVCRRKAEERGIAARFEFHDGYLETLPPAEAFDAATSLLVSQFILDREARTEFLPSVPGQPRPAIDAVLQAAERRR